jgi:hypothetical protein
LRQPTRLAPTNPLHPYTLANMLAAALPTRLHPVDLVLILVYLIGITLFGLHFRSSKDPNTRSLRSYFLANQTIPWWAIALSIVSAETSTLTIISIPGLAFAGDFGFLQLVIGYMIGRIVVAIICSPPTSSSTGASAAPSTRSPPASSSSPAPQPKVSASLLSPS